MRLSACLGVQPFGFEAGSCASRWLEHNYLTVIGSNVSIVD